MYVVCTQTHSRDRRTPPPHRSTNIHHLFTCVNIYIYTMGHHCQTGGTCMYRFHRERDHFSEHTLWYIHSPVQRRLKSLVTYHTTPQSVWCVVMWLMPRLSRSSCRRGSVQVRDAVAVIQLLMWLEKAVPEGKETELTAAHYVNKCRGWVHTVVLCCTSRIQSDYTTYFIIRIVTITLTSKLPNLNIITANRKTAEAQALRRSLQVDPMRHWPITGTIYLCSSFSC